MHTIWIFVILAVHQFEPPQIIELKKFSTIVECQQYADAHHYQRETALGCLPALVPQSN